MTYAALVSELHGLLVNSWLMRPSTYSRLPSFGVCSLVSSVGLNRVHDHR